jgi:hypothetical protein
MPGIGFTSHAMSLKFMRIVTLIILFGFTSSSCSFELPAPDSAPLQQPTEVAQVVTQLVTREVTQEVTRVIVVPVTVTPSATLQYTLTPSLTPTITETPTITSTPEPPVISVSEYSDCLYGPAEVYLYKTSLPAGALEEVVGRSWNNTWLEVQEVHGWNPCWLPATRVTGDIGDINRLPVVVPVLPRSNQYGPPDAIARRNGSEVTIAWQAVWMSLDDYRGYLIEAWVCQGGKQIFLPLSYVPPLDNNTGELSVKITDEPGCQAPSNGRIYSAGKRGYSTSQIIFWPAN